MCVFCCCCYCFVIALFLCLAGDVGGGYRSDGCVRGRELPALHVHDLRDAGTAHDLGRAQDAKREAGWACRFFVVVVKLHLYFFKIFVSALWLGHAEHVASFFVFVFCSFFYFYFITNGYMPTVQRGRALVTLAC